MADNVIFLPCITKLDTPAERVLNGAKDADLEACVVVGYTKAGDFYFASSYADGGDVVWALEKAKYKIIKITEAEDD